MTLTIKDPPKVTSQANAGSSSQNSENATAQSPRSNPVCLEVPITIRSLPADHGNDPNAPGPIREEGRSVIVFDNGGVLRISNPLAVGQTVILSNQQGRDVVCRVAAGRNLPNIKGYIEVEFIERVTDFWQIHQNLEPASGPSAGVSLPVSTTALPVAQSPAPPVTTRATALDAESSGSAPTFEDIAGLVNMSAPAVRADKKIENVSLLIPSKTSDESGLSRTDTPLSVTSPAVVPSVLGSTPVKPANHPVQEIPSVPLRSPSFSNNMTGNLIGGGTAPPPSSAQSQGQMRLIIGGVALVLVGFGAGFFLMHRGSTSATAPVAIASQPSAQPISAPTNAPAPFSAPEPEQQAQPAPQPVSIPAPVASAERAPAVSELPKAQRPANIVESKQPDRVPARSSSIPNLKMSSPTSPRRDIANGSSLGAPDLTAATVSGGVPADALLPSVARSENQPAPPPSAAPQISSVKSATSPKLISSTHPIYPDMAKQTKAQGNVVVAFTVDPQGDVVDVKAISGPILLRQAAIDAVKKWKYSPALFDGKPTSSQITATLDFRLN